MNLIPLRITLCCCVLLAACGDDKTTPLPDASAAPDSAVTQDASASGDTSGTADSLSDANDATSTGGDISSDAAQTGITQKDLCPLLAAKTCAALTACGCPFDSYGTTACVDVQRGRCEKSIVAYLGGVSIGALLFDGVAANACIAAFDQLGTSCEKPSERNRPDACRSLFVDTAAVGGACSSYSAGLLCAGGQGVCDPQMGTCKSLPKQGESCQPANRCAAGLVCEGGACVPRSGAGGKCLSDNGCQAGLTCGPNNTCTAGLAAGSKCNVTDQCAAGLACLGGVCATAAADGQVCVSDVCASGHYCVPGPPQQVCRPKVGANEPCNMPDSCQAGLYCDFSVGSLCEPIPTVGEACPSFQCAPGLSCDAASVCATPPGDGQPCLKGATPDCAAGLNCDAATMTCKPAGGAGSPCPTGNCGSGTVCNWSGVDPVCQSPGPAGTTCYGMDSLCLPGLYCDGYTNQCAAQSPVGGKCGGPNMCAPGNYCKYANLQATQGTCAPLPDTVGAPCDVLCAGGLRCGPQDGHCHKGLCAML